MSMWTKIRNNKNLTLDHLALILNYKGINVSKQSLSKYESGKRKMPYNIMIEYLKMRGAKEDLIIIEFLEGLK